MVPGVKGGAGGDGEGPAAAVVRARAAAAAQMAGQRRGRRSLCNRLRSGAQ
jgi:hypothetical protein